MNEKESDFFEKHGLEVQGTEVEVGQTYPIYGMITAFISEDLENEVIVEVNQNLNIKVMISEEDKLNILKERSFEPGIFVTEITENEKGLPIKGLCKTVVFGKKKYIEV